MGSKTFDGVWFIAYSHDHPPPHVHRRYGEVELIVELLPNGRIRKSMREDAVIPSNAKRSDIKRILVVAKRHGDELLKLRRKSRG